MIKEKLNKLFKLLRNEGFVALQNAACCSSRSLAKIDDLLKKRKKQMYAYYHRQNAADIIKYNTVYIGYGHISGEDNDNKIVGQTIVDTAKEAGLKIDWDGNSYNKILLSEFGKHSDHTTDLENEIDYLRGIIAQRDNMIYELKEYISDLEEELRDMRSN
jgi:predicted HTH domain antitoxin